MEGGGVGKLRESIRGLFHFVSFLTSSHAPPPPPPRNIYFSGCRFQYVASELSLCRFQVAAIKVLTDLRQEEGITTVCNTYEAFHENKPPIPTAYLRQTLELILNSFQ